MKKNKIISILTLPLVMASLASCFGQKEKVDPKLYHLTFSANKEVDMSLVKATYAAGTSGSKVVTKGTRDPDEIKALLDAGATQADIDKAGVRQEDGSYFFFDQDPMYLEAPKLEGYRTPVFYNKANSADFYKPGLHKDAEGNERLYFWNMPGKDTEMEVRYEAVQYEILWQIMPSELGFNNPNAGRTTYNFENDNFVTLEPATFENKSVEFVGWEYQDVNQLDDHGQAKWVLLEDSKLPVNTDEANLRIQPRYQVKRFGVSFEFETYEGDSLSFDVVLQSMTLQGNLCNVDGEELASGGTKAITSSTESIKIDSIYGWATFFYELKPGYEVFCFKLNSERNDGIDASHMNPPYVNIDQGVLKDDSVVTFVVTPK